MIKRKIDAKLEDWFTNFKKKVLFIDGPRQVGKSYTIEHFCKAHFKNYIEFNFVRNPEFVDSLKGVKNLDQLLLKLGAIKDLKDDSDETLIFLDEIQELDETDIVSMLKFITKESKRCFAISGSLLGVSIKNYRSWPMGYVYFLQMNSLDFEEFLWAFSVSQNILNHLDECFTSLKKVDDIVHQKVLELFSLYVILGGMPEAVQTYIDSKSFSQTDNVLKQINVYYEHDISKYEKENNKLYIKEIYELIPSELNNKNKRFILKNLNEYTKFNKFDASFIWLSKAGVTLPTYNVSNLNVPLTLSKERTLFKLFHYDTGLLISLFADASLKIKILNQKQDVNFGSIYENAVAKELFCHGFNNLYYYNSKKLGEIDFVVEQNNEVIPLEVKSGKGYFEHRALNNIFDSYPTIKKGYVLGNGNIEIKGNVIYLPIYMVMFFKNEVEDESDYLDDIRFDFSAIQ